MKVLIVDDRAENRLLLREQLRGVDAEPVAADSGVRALRELRAQPFDLVITDLLMPEMDGFQLCYLLKTDPQRKKMPVIIYTANYATKRDEEQAKDLGADDFITRPIEEEELAARIRSVMDRARTGHIAEPRAKPKENFFREYSTLLIQKLEDQLITAEENVRLLAHNAELQRELERRNAELKSAIKELERVNADLEAFSYSVSHDLRAPTRAIEGMLALLTEELADAMTPSAEQFAERIRYNIGRMNALISGLLAHSRMRDLSAALRPVDLGTAVTSAISGLDFSIRESAARVRVEGEMPAVIAHEQALVQVITNLIDNALKFVAPGTVPDVRVTTQRNGDRVRLSVRDNGIGIAADKQSRLFAVFERLHPQAKYPGTGLGLAIVRRGIEGMHGTVGLESAPGRGSTFWIELPAAP